MAESEHQRAMREGERSSAEAVRGAPLLPDTSGERTHRRALRSWAAEGFPALWARHKWLVIGVGLFLLLDLVAALAVAASGGHF